MIHYFENKFALPSEDEYACAKQFSGEILEHMPWRPERLYSWEHFFGRKNTGNQPLMSINNRMDTIIGRLILTHIHYWYSLAKMRFPDVPQAGHGCWVQLTRVTTALHLLVHFFLAQVHHRTEGHQQQERGQSLAHLEGASIAPFKASHLLTTPLHDWIFLPPGCALQPNRLLLMNKKLASFL